LSKNDFFAAIADTNITYRKDFMEKKQPVQIPDVFFEETNEELVSLENTYTENNDLKYKMDLAEYKSGILKLKKQYTTYLTRRSRQANQRKRFYLKNFDFRFETSDDCIDFSAVLNGDGDWERVSIPHYHGPTGKWISFYRTVFDYDKNDLNDYLIFKGSDYLTDVYLNGRLVLSHEGFFASFEENITRYLKDKGNTLVIKVENDITTLGENKRFGKKIYAATGIGWDDPDEGWHHCPPGGGIFDNVYIEKRNDVFISDVCVYPDIDDESANIKVVVKNSNPKKTKIKVSIFAEPFNFDSSYRYEAHFDKPIHDGENHYYFDIEVKNQKLWNNETPNLYSLIIRVDDHDEYEQHFGMREFHMDTAKKPFGTLYLNNSPIMLRGANEMGHLQICVIKEDYEQLIEDILIAKYCNMNYYRITQRPVQSEIYDYCDMLGMMVQVDFPLFGQLVKSQVYEAARQVGEMERHIRRHPSVIMVSYINEPTDQYRSETSHINLNRAEMENWFDICDRFIKHENPYRVIKRVEGDYDPPTFEGLSDFHCYNMWYTNHAIPIGDLYKGYLPALRKDWKTGCGEYGAEGLDNFKLMKERYPKEWLPENENDYWLPDKIVKAQTNSMHGDWFYEQDNIKDWILFSQNHQAKSVSMMTLALRRRSDYIVQTALHLLIDAYPSGWMKTVVGVDREPKPAYFEFKRALIPFKINLRCDRWSCYKNDFIDVECWLLNDEPKAYKDVKIKAALFDENRNVLKKYALYASADRCSSNSVGKIHIVTSDIEVISRKKLFLEAQMEYQGKLLDKDIFSFNIFEQNYCILMAYPLGTVAEHVVNTSPHMKFSELKHAEVIVVSDKIHVNILTSMADMKNKKILFILNEDLNDFVFNGNTYSMSDKRMWKATYCPINQSLLNGYNWDDLSYLYDSCSDKINFTAEYFIQCEKQDEVFVYNYKKPSFGESALGKKEKRPVLMKNTDGIFTTLNLKGRTGVNPVIDRVLYDVIRR